MLSTVTLGEFIDEADFVNDLKQAIGLSPNETDEEAATEKMGTERLGTENVLDNLGLTLLIVSSIFVLLILVIVLLVTIKRKCKNLSEKNKERIEKVKLSVFWNPIIRYTFLNCLKLNTTAMTGLFLVLTTDSTQIAVSSVIFATMCIVPFIYSRILYKNSDMLEDEKFNKKYSTLYNDLRVKAVSEEKEPQTSVCLFPAVFMIRRTLFVAVSVNLFDYPNLQIACQIVITILSSAYLIKQNPFDSQSRRYTEVLNDTIMLWISILL